MSKTLAIVGSGHLGLHIAHYAISDNHYSKVVFIDDFADEKEKNGFKIIGKTTDIEKLFNENLFDHIIIGIGYNHLDKRRYLFEKYINVVPFGKIIHSTCSIDSTAEVKDGCVLYPNCTVDLGAVISENTIVANSTMIAHNVFVDKHCFLSASLAIAGFVQIGQCCYVGINSTVIDSVSICNNVQLGAGTVVIKNIDKEGLYVGNPQKFIR